MKKFITALIVLGAVSAAPLAATAAASQKSHTASKPAASPKATTHAAGGVIKSIDGNTMVVSRSGKNGGEMTFVMNDSTDRKGNLAVGTPVSVRYHQDGRTNVATAVHAEQAGKATKSGAKH